LPGEGQTERRNYCHVGGTHLSGKKKWKAGVGGWTTEKIIGTP